MKYEIMQLTLEEAMIESARGNKVLMINLDLFEKIREIYYMPVGEIVGLANNHDVVFIMLQEDPFFRSDQNG